MIDKRESVVGVASRGVEEKKGRLSSTGLRSELSLVLAGLCFFRLPGSAVLKRLKKSGQVFFYNAPRIMVVPVIFGRRQEYLFGKTQMFDRRDRRASDALDDGEKVSYGGLGHFSVTFAGTLAR